MPALRSLVLAGALLASAALLGGCGGGGGGGDGPTAPEPPPLTGPGEVPGTAASSVTAFLAYLRQVVGLMPEDAEPVGINGLTPPVSETDEPEPLS